MRTQLNTEIINVLAPYRANLPFEDIKAQIVIILSNYEVENRNTEIVVRDEDVNNHYLALFLASKAAGGRTDKTLHAYKGEISELTYAAAVRIGTLAARVRVLEGEDDLK